jgi:hypothetical protein
MWLHDSPQSADVVDCLIASNGGAGMFMAYYGTPLRVRV